VLELDFGQRVAELGLSALVSEPQVQARRVQQRRVQQGQGQELLV